MYFFEHYKLLNRTFVPLVKHHKKTKKYIYNIKKSFKTIQKLNKYCKLDKQMMKNSKMYKICTKKSAKCSK